MADTRADATANTGGVDIPDRFVSDMPSGDLPFKLFEGEWSCEIPGYGFGYAKVFEDYRITWLEKQCGGFKGKRILELGPLEGGHTYMMSKAGAASITSIESNKRAFLKCLVVQNALKFEADFQLGDFRPYLASCTDTYDILMASGVLYHMSDPVMLLRNAARISNQIGMWTHYYDADAVRGRDHLEKYFDARPRIEKIGSRILELHQKGYGDATDWAGFSGSAAPVTYWFSRDSLLGILEELGFKVTIGEDRKDHPNGPAMLLYASRERT